MRCPNGHQHRIISGIPILFREDVEETHWHATQARQASEEGYPSASTNGINDYVQAAIAATGGIVYVPLTGRLAEYRSLPRGCRLAVDARLLIWAAIGAVDDRRGSRRIQSGGAGFLSSSGPGSLRRCATIGIDADFVVGDARYLPFANNAFDAAFSYSVLQHFSKPDVRQTLTECSRVLAADGFSLIQMANKLGIRSLFHQAKRRFREPSLFQVRYWTPRELETAFRELIGPTAISVDGFFSLNAQPREAHLLPARFGAVVTVSEMLRSMSNHLPALRDVADSVYVESHKDGRIGR